MPALNSKTITYEQLAKTIDHSLLKPELTEADITAGCQLAARYHVASVCVKPSFVPLAVELLKGSDVAVGTVRLACMFSTSRLAGPTIGTTVGTGASAGRPGASTGTAAGTATAGGGATRPTAGR